MPKSLMLSLPNETGGPRVVPTGVMPDERGGIRPSPISATQPDGRGGIRPSPSPGLPNESGGVRPSAVGILPNESGGPKPRTVLALSQALYPQGGSQRRGAMR